MGTNSYPTAIVLTHGHFDHIGALRELLQTWDVPVYAHPLERPYLVGDSSYPPPDPAVGGGMMSSLSRFYPRGPINLGSRLRLLPVLGEVPGLSDWKWLHTPGHTAGHISLFRESDRTLIAGDAFVTTRQESLIGALSKRPQVWRCPAYYTSDWSAAHDSIKLLASCDPAVAATGHGAPMRGARLREGLQWLLENWDSVRPQYGRYADEAAETDETGVVWAPPPVVDRQLVRMGSLAALSALCLWYVATRSRRMPNAEADISCRRQTF
jgi:glyoxylase-like metal-dependent hydrolase (beta-lactamase superfamily II)